MKLEFHFKTTLFSYNSDQFVNYSTATITKINSPLKNTLRWV